MPKFFKVLSVFTLLFAIPVGIYLVSNPQFLFNKASGVPANLTINDAAKSQSNFAWKNLAQGGEEQTDMLANVLPQVTSLHPNYIRIDHVYDFYSVISKTNGKLNFNWTNLDHVISEITSTGAKPFLSLSYNYDNYSDWETIVQNTIQHVSGDLHISNVYYEIWNEPDLFGGYKTYGDKNYFDLYKFASLGAQNARNVMPFKIGGPATTQLYQSWATDFAKFVLANNLRLDFYSWHKYSTDLDNFENNYQNAYTWLIESGLPNNTELVISEFGPTSVNDPSYNNNFGAIHEIATAASLEDKINKLFTFEIKDGPVNKWGILTHDGMAKPRYNALQFLNNMTGDAVQVSGQGSWVKAFAKDDGKILKTLVVNYDPDNAHTEAVPLNFTNLPSQNFEYKRLDFNGLSASAEVSKDIQVATNSANWSTLELLQPNSTSIMEIIPQ